RERHPVFGDPARRPDDLLRERPRDGAADRRCDLVSRRRVCAVDRPVLPRTAFRARPTRKAGEAGRRGSEGVMTQMVIASDVVKRFGAFTALSGISLAVDRSEVLCIVGPSGSGKSTFLRCINQLERPDQGAIWVDGDLCGFRQKGNVLVELSDREI